MKILINTITDDKFIRGTEVLFKSLRKNITNPEGHKIEYSYSTFTPLENEYLKSIGARNIIIPKEYDFLDKKNNNHPGRYISLHRFHILKEQGYDRIISLDSDMLVLRNVDYLLSSELNEALVWMCKDYGCPHYYPSELKPSQYFNGGLQIWIGTVSDFHDYLLNQLTQSYDGSDQGYLSYWARDTDLIRQLPDEYNYAFEDAFYPKIDLPRIVHFTGLKPWTTVKTTPYHIAWYEEAK